MYEDYLPAEQQLTLDSAFSELVNGLSLWKPRLNESQLRDAEARLGVAYDACRSGDRRAGIKAMQELEKYLDTSIRWKLKE